MPTRQLFVRLLACTAAFFLAACVNPLSADDKSWVGENVLHTKPANEIRFWDDTGGKVVEFSFSGHFPFQVREDKDGRLRIHDRIHEGWVNKSDFVLAKEAIPYFTRRLETNPKDSHALKMRGAAYQQSKELDKALADYTAYIELNPNKSEGYNNRGLAYRDKKEWDKAIADYSEAVRVDPKNVIAWLNRGVAWRNKNEYDKAIADYDEAIRLEPKMAIAWYFRGAAWSHKNDYEKAIKDYDESIRLDPKYAPAYRDRGLAHGHTKYYKEALDDYENAVKLDAKFIGAFADQSFLLATCPEAKFRDGKKAVAAAQKACELGDYKNATHFTTLAAAHAEAGDFKEAVKWQKKAMDDAEYMKSNADQAKSRLKLYEADMPYHQSAPK
jgi:tetratricopeptide (TPR) repeat protein